MLSHRISDPHVDSPDILKITPTPITAALAGLVAGTTMPVLWMRFADDTMLLLVGFLLVVALPAHALVLGFGHASACAGTVDTALLTRAVVWLLTAAVALGVSQMLAN